MRATVLTAFHRPAADRPRPLPAPVAAALLCVVLTGHALLLAPPATAPVRGPTPTLQVRTVRIGPGEAGSLARPGSDGRPLAVPVRRVAAAAPPDPHEPHGPVSPRDDPDAERGPPAQGEPGPDPLAPTGEAMAEGGGATGNPPPALGELGTWPVYATALPGPVVLRYAWRRGSAQGQSELRFEREGDGYRLSLQQQGDGQPRRGSTSQGRIDANGLAPERLADSRKDRELRAANFRRDQGRITFSGPTTEAPLLDGAQDRLSWLMQLAGILAANPALTPPGHQVQLFVAGTRGDAEVWRFEVVGSEDLALPAGGVRGALHLRREPSRPRDLTVDVWLDPARQHLPVRLVQRLHPHGPGSEWLLLDAQGSGRP